MTFFRYKTKVLIPLVDRKKEVLFLDIDLLIIIVRYKGKEPRHWSIVEEVLDRYTSRLSKYL